jgi:hypothetical protein
MKYIIFILLFLPLFGYSQQDTIKIPSPVAKQIVKDLISGDSAKAELLLCNENVNLLKQKITFKDSIISSHIQKGILYEERIKNEQQKFEVQGVYVKSLERDLKKIKVKFLFTKITLVSIIGGLTYFYIKK